MNNEAEFAKNWAMMWSVVAVVFGIVWAFLPFLLLSSLNRIRKEVVALREDLAKQSTRTNQLLEWIGTIQQQPAGSP